MLSVIALVGVMPVTALANSLNVDFDQACENVMTYFDPLLHSAGLPHYCLELNRGDWPNLNWWSDSAELYILHEVLANPNLQPHAGSGVTQDDIVNAYQANRAQAAIDLGGAGTNEDNRLGDYVAGVVTMSSYNGQVGT
jgi:hypothetical protein